MTQISKASQRRRSKGVTTELYNQAVEYCRNRSTVSFYELRDALSITIPDAKALFAELERKKVIGPANATRPRVVLLSEIKQAQPAVSQDQNAVIELLAPRLTPRLNVDGLTEIERHALHASVQILQAILHQVQEKLMSMGNGNQSSL